MQILTDENGKVLTHEGKPYTIHKSMTNGGGAIENLELSSLNIEGYLYQLLALYKNKSISDYIMYLVNKRYIAYINDITGEDDGPWICQSILVDLANNRIYRSNDLNINNNFTESNITKTQKTLCFNEEVENLVCDLGKFELGETHEENRNLFVKAVAEKGNEKGIPYGTIYIGVINSLGVYSSISAQYNQGTGDVFVSETVENARSTFSRYRYKVKNNTIVSQINETPYTKNEVDALFANAGGGGTSTLTRIHTIENVTIESNNIYQDEIPLISIGTKLLLTLQCRATNKKHSIEFTYFDYNDSQPVFNVNINGVETTCRIVLSESWIELYFTSNVSNNKINIYIYQIN